MPERAEPRIAKHANVRIFGMDSKGNPINVPAVTLDISKHGARLMNVRYWDCPGETIGVRYKNDKARYRVVWVGKPNSPVEGQVGLFCVDNKYIWDVAPPGDERKAPIVLATRAGGNEAEAPPSIAHYYDRRRKDPRHLVQGGANVRETGKSVPQWTMLHDVSMGGCYVETTAPLPVSSRVEITIQAGDIRIEARGEVVAKHPLVGMGIRFSEMSPEHRETLRNLIWKLEHTPASASD